MPLLVREELLQVLRKEASGEHPRSKSDVSPGQNGWRLTRDFSDVRYLLSVLLFEGLGGKQNLEEAIEWLISSAKGGCPRAVLDLPRISRAYKFELPVDVQVLLFDWVAQGSTFSPVISFPDRFSFDTLESLDPSLFQTTVDKLENQCRSSATTSSLWGFQWRDALSSACSNFYFAHCAEPRQRSNFLTFVSFAISQATTNTEEFLAFLMSTPEKSTEVRALKDYGSGLQWIHFLANFGMIEVLRTVLNLLKIDLETSDSDGRTPLYFATICGNSSMVDFLLDRGAKAAFGKDEDSTTCLHLVTSFKRQDISRMAQRLVQAEANVNAQTGTGATPLHKALMQTASKSSNHAAAEVLLRCGADPCIRDNDGETPHYWAVVLLQPESLELLLRATQDKMSENDFLFLKAHLFDHLITVPQFDMASFAGSQFPESLDKIVCLLLDESTLRVYKTLPDNGEDSAFFSVSARGKLELMRSICRCLPFVDVNEAEIENNRPALRHAIRHNKYNVVETLLALGANPFYTDSLGENALHVAATYAPELLGLLLRLSNKADTIGEILEAKSIHGLTPFDNAVINGNLDAARTLIDSGASHSQFRCLTKEGTKTTTLGHILSRPSTSLEQIDFLLQLEKSPTISDDGSTVFHALATLNSDIRDEGLFAHSLPKVTQYAILYT